MRRRFRIHSCGFSRFENFEVEGVAVSEVLQDIGLAFAEGPFVFVSMLEGFGEVFAEVTAYGLATVVEVKQLVEQCGCERVGNLGQQD